MKEFFTEDNGRLSSMRLMCFLSLLVAIAITIMAVLKGTIDQTFTLIITWLSAAFGGKIGQKITENKVTGQDEELKK